MAILSILEIGAKIIDKIIPDTEARDKAKLVLAQEEMRGGLEELKAAANVVLGEINGESWLQRNWRPILMLTFAGLIVAKWLGFTAPGITEEAEKSLFDILQVGIGGYVIGRSVEKGIREWKKS